MGTWAGRAPLTRPIDQGRAQPNEQGGARRCESGFVGDICAARECDLSFDLACHTGRQPWLAHSNRRHQLADGDHFDVGRHGRLGAGFDHTARIRPVDYRRGPG